MNLLERLKRAGKAFKGEKRCNSAVGFVLNDDDLCCTGYTRLSDCPEIQTACLRIAELIGSMTIYLMSNTDKGDERIINELSRKIDIEPCDNLSRMQWMTFIVMTMLLYGKGNCIVVPHTYNGLLQSLEPLAAERVQLQPEGMSYRKYKVIIDGVPRKPDDLLHFTYNPDMHYPWKGQGIQVLLKDIADNLKQGQKTVNAFLSSEWKPSIIVKVDALTDEFSSPEGRKKLLDTYINPSTPGEPWMIPAEAFDVEQVRPLSLSDLAIVDTMELDKKAVAAIIGVPAFLLGVGSFNRDEWNNFVQTKVRTIAQGIQQVLTKGLIINPKWYLLLNFWSLLDYDMQTVSNVLLAGADRGYICGDEWRDRMHMTPAGLKDFKILENYIPYDMSGNQKKLVTEE